MNRSKESDCSPAALPLLSPRRIFTTDLGEMKSFGLLMTLDRVTIPSSGGRWSGRFNDGGVSFSRELRLPPIPAVMGATGVVLVRRALAEDKLSTSAEAWAEC